MKTRCSYHFNDLNLDEFRGEDGLKTKIGIYFFFLSSSKRRDRSSKSISSSLLFPSVEFGTSGKSNGTFGKLGRSSLAGGGADAGGGDIFDLGCGFGVLFKFYKK